MLATRGLMCCGLRAKSEALQCNGHGWLFDRVFLRRSAIGLRPTGRYFEEARHRQQRGALAIRHGMIKPR